MLQALQPQLPIVSVWGVRQVSPGQIKPKLSTRGVCFVLFYFVGNLDGPTF